MEEEVKRQEQLLQEIEQSYDVWESNLTEAEAQLFDYEDKIQAIFNGRNIADIVQELEANYTKLEKEVQDLEAKSNRKDSVEVSKSDELLDLIKRLSTSISNANNASQVKIIDSQLKNVQQVLEVVNQANQ